MNTQNYDRATAYFREMERKHPDNPQWGEFADAMDGMIERANLNTTVCNESDRIVYVPINCPRCGFNMQQRFVIKRTPVVRCKDCKAWKQYDDMNLGECELYPEYNKMGDWFCNFGERKEGR